MKIAHLLTRLAKADVIVFTDGETIKLRHSQPLEQSLLKIIRSQKPEIIHYLKQPNYTLWFYKIDNQHGYTRMGLMTTDHQQAQQQLEAIYNKPITRLQRRQRYDELVCDSHAVWHGLIS